MFFIYIDLISGCFQMALDEDSHNFTVFITPMSLYKWKELTMGLDSAPGAFQNLVELKLSELSYGVVLT